jgi:hypothetical protein
MQALSDDQHIASIEAKVDRLEKKIDAGFAEMRADSIEVRAQIVSTERALRGEMVAATGGLRGEMVAARNDARADFRTLIGVVIAMWTATVLGVVGVLVNHL